MNWVATMIDSPCPAFGRRFVVEASGSQPDTRRGHERDNPADCEIHATRTATSQRALFFLQRGRWVEVYDDDTKELLAGPFDPDQAANGVTGLKPTWGRVSVNGAFELAASLDHIGPMCRSAADCGAMLGLMAGADPRDPSARVEPVPDYLAGNPHRLRDLHDLRIGIDPAQNSAGVDGAMRATVDDAADVLRALGAAQRHVVFPDPIDAIRDWPATCAVKPPSPTKSLSRRSALPTARAWPGSSTWAAR